MPIFILSQPQDLHCHLSAIWHFDGCHKHMKYVQDVILNSPPPPPNKLIWYKTEYPQFSPSLLRESHPESSFNAPPKGLDIKYKWFCLPSISCNCLSLSIFTPSLCIQVFQLLIYFPLAPNLPFFVLLYDPRAILCKLHFFLCQILGLASWGWRVCWRDSQSWRRRHLSWFFFSTWQWMNQHTAGPGGIPCGGGLLPWFQLVNVLQKLSSSS